MEDSRKGLINKQRVAALAALILLLIILLLLIWWWFIRPVTNEPAPQTPEISGSVVLPPQLPTDTSEPVQQEPLTPAELEVRALARNFSERYGSFSTESDFQNLIDLYPVITSPLRNRFESVIAAGIVDDQFKGVSTKALSVAIDRLEGDEADVTVMTQRVTTNASLQESVAYQGIQLEMTKVGNSWYVSSATWQ